MAQGGIGRRHSLIQPDTELCRGVADTVQEVTQVVIAVADTDEEHALVTRRGQRRPNKASGMAPVIPLRA